MVEQGLVAEVEALKARPDLHLQLPSMRCVGYRQVWQYLDGDLSYEQMIERGIIATRQLAKRQLTWLRSWDSLQDLPESTEDALQLILKMAQRAPR
jgi:tRNA dimethylallyltransferase